MGRKGLEVLGIATGVPASESELHSTRVKELELELVEVELQHEEVELENEKRTAKYNGI